MGPNGVGDQLWLEPVRLVQARGVNGDRLRICGEGPVDRRAAGGTEGVDLVVAAVAGDAPFSGPSVDLHRGALREGQIGRVPGAASLLAVAALAVDLDGRFVSLDEPEQLVMRTWINLPDGSTWFAVEQTVRFEEIDGRTIQHFSAEVLEARADAIGPLSGMEMGWSQSLDKLAAHIRAVTAAGG